MYLLVVGLVVSVAALFSLSFLFWRQGRKFRQVEKENAGMKAKLGAWGKNRLDADKEVKESYRYLIRKFQEVANIHQHETSAHLDRVSIFSGMIAAYFGASQQEQEDIMIFSRLHDLGKVLVPLDIVMKPGKLNMEEIRTMRRHTLWGAELIGMAEWLSVAYNICLTHHERWDGTGYPYGLKGKEIPLEGRIVAFADVYDALRSPRSYKKALTHEEVTKILMEGDGRTLPHHFDPDILGFFAEHHEEMGRLFDDLH